MTRHQGAVAIGRNELVLRCHCGWRRSLGATCELQGVEELMTEHYVAVHGHLPDNPGKARYGWNEETPPTEPPTPV